MIVYIQSHLIASNELHKDRIALSYLSLASNNILLG